MYEFYIDDTEKGCFNDKEYMPILGGFVASHDEYVKIEQDFRQLKQEFNLNKFTPIKWSPGSKDPIYQEQRSLSDQNQFREAVLRKISENNITIIVSIIDVDGLFKTQKLESYRTQALEQLSQRFQLFFSDPGIKSEDSGQIILDNPGNSESKLSRYYREICCNGCTYVDMELKNLSKTLYISHSFANEGLQIADYIVGAVGYTIKTKNKRYFNLIKDKVRNRGGNMKGIGIIIFPSNSTSIDLLFS